MSALELTLRADPGQRIDLSQLTPDGLSGLSEADISKLKINTNKKTITVSDVFDMKMGDTSHIRFAGLNTRSDRVGDGMQSGQITIEGEAGTYTGARMRAGRLEVTGNTGPYSGASMKGGHMVVHGNAADYAGGRHQGEAHGISGGILQIMGNTGNYAAERMRKGLFLIGGDSGDFLASRMIAGTLIASGETGHWPGYGMRRGTLILNSDTDTLLPTYSDCGVLDLAILNILKRNLETIGAGDVITSTRVRRYAGDMASLGKGEILIPA